MSDAKATETDEGSTVAVTVSDEIGRSLSSIWQRRSGVRPDAISTDFRGDVVKCVIEEGTAEEPAADSDEAPQESSIGTNAYQHEAAHAVAKLTRRSVSAFIAKRDPKTGVATHTFILEHPRTKF